jgi:hypothetical protein
MKNEKALRARKREACVQIHKFGLLMMAEGGKSFIDDIADSTIFNSPTTFRK